MRRRQTPGRDDEVGGRASRAADSSQSSEPADLARLPSEREDPGLRARATAVRRGRPGSLETLGEFGGELERLSSSPTSTSASSVFAVRVSAASESPRASRQPIPARMTSSAARALRTAERQPQVVVEHRHLAPLPGLGRERNRLAHVLEPSGVAELAAGQPAEAERARRAAHAELLGERDRTLGVAERRPHTGRG